MSKCTTKENRGKAFLYFEGLFSIGSVCGPAIGSVLIFNVDFIGELYTSIFEHAHVCPPVAIERVNGMQISMQTRSS